MKVYIAEADIFGYHISTSGRTAQEAEGRLYRECRRHIQQLHLGASLAPSVHNQADFVEYYACAAEEYDLDDATAHWN